VTEAPRTETPTDRDGRPLRCGDVVSLECVIIGIDEHHVFINAELESVEPMYPELDKRVHVMVNTRQVTFLREGPPREQAKAISAPEIEMRDAQGGSA